MKRVVVKFGSGILSENEGRALDRDQFFRIAREASELRRAGIQLVFVSSGAVAAGVPLLGLDDRPSDLAGKQACAAVGQPALIDCYAEFLGNHGLCVGQVLLTHSDIDSRIRRINARNTLERLLQAPRVIPVVNENDTVAVEELRFGDNDRLSAEVAVLLGADLLLILTSVDGLLNGAELVEELPSAEEGYGFITGETGKFSVGGMKTKLDAAGIAAAAGIPTWIANGRVAGNLSGVADRSTKGTRIPGSQGVPAGKESPLPA